MELYYSSKTIGVVSRKEKASLLVVILLGINVLNYVLYGFLGLEHRKFVFLAFSLLLFSVSLLQVREEFSWLDFVVGIMLAIGILYYRFISQVGYSSILFNLPFFVTGFSIAILFKYSYFPRWPFVTYATLAIAPFLYAFFILKIRLEGQSFFFSMNRNTIPLLLITITALQVMNDALNDRYIMVYPSALIVVCSYFSMSRAGLLLSLCLFCIVLLANGKDWLYKSEHRIFWVKEHKVIGFTLLIVVGIIVLVGIWIFLKDTRLVLLGIKDSARVSLALEFFDQLTLKNFLIGFRPSLTMNTRLHNSFLTMLSYYGIFTFGLYFLIAISLLHYMKHSFVLFGVFGVWCLHSLVESISPLDVGDFLFIPLIMIALYQKGWELFPDKKKPIELVRSVLKK